MPLSRGINPVWLLDDLDGNIMDDTFYLFTLQNTLPYLPSPTWEDAGGNTFSPNPIPVLANGTMPVNIYWDTDVTYRLEWRQGPTQADALTYLVENYVPLGVSGGSTSVADVSTENQITNPQFAQVNFNSPLIISTATTTEIAPGWHVVTLGAGTLTVSQVTYTGTDYTDNSNPTNAAYGIRFVNLGFDSVQLYQRFNGNGSLWAGEFVAMNITASGDANELNGWIRYSGAGSAQDINIISTPLTSVNNEYNKSSTRIPFSTNADQPGVAWTEVSFEWIGNVTVNLTSIQVVGQSVTEVIPYLQTTPQRQIDQEYNIAYPIVPVGTIIDFGGFPSPLHYLACDGVAKNRTTYSALFSALTLVKDFTVATNVSFTVASAAQLRIGMFVEGSGIPVGTTISNIVGLTITVSAVTTSVGTISATIFAWGQGDGSTTFNPPNLQGYVTAGADGTLFGTNLNGVGYKGGSTDHAIQISEMPAHTHTGSTDNWTTFNTLNGTVGLARNYAVTGSTTAINVASQGGGAPMTIVQPTAIVYKYIRYQ